MKNLTVLLTIVAVFVNAQQTDTRCYRERMLIESQQKLYCGEHIIYSICGSAAHIDQPAAGQWVDSFKRGYYPQYGCFKTMERPVDPGTCKMKCRPRGGYVCDAV
ncbi:MAG: hypothetical protein J3R72DRAFT_420944 [Linnemannia gamsii]|nr:MAG: hypothetical protein J3R72DRAFT_420944 [Linnemannia gamsii]